MPMRPIRFMAAAVAPGLGLPLLSQAQQEPPREALRSGMMRMTMDPVAAAIERSEALELRNDQRQRLKASHEEWLQRTAEVRDRPRSTSGRRTGTHRAHSRAPGPQDDHSSPPDARPGAHDPRPTPSLVGTAPAPLHPLRTLAGPSGQSPSRLNPSRPIRSSTERRRARGSPATRLRSGSSAGPDRTMIGARASRPIP